MDVEVAQVARSVRDRLWITLGVDDLKLTHKLAPRPTQEEMEMIVGDLLLVMNGDPYFGPPMTRSTCKAVFSVQVTNRTGSSALQIDIEHRNRDDTSWAVAGSFATINANGTYSDTVSGLKELVRYKFTFGAGDPEDGMYVFAAAPQWLND
jgi:hypothetical protein